MSAKSPVVGVPASVEVAPRGFSVVGGVGARLMGGPTAAAGRESWWEHEHRLGPLDLARCDPGDLRHAVRESGLLGRGGAGFETATKLDVAARSPGVPLVVVNASEGEPASRKDQTLLELRPHLVIDGALVAARAVGASDVLIYTHRSHRRSGASLLEALAERPGGETPLRVIDAPDGYVAGETNAAISFLEGGAAVPRRREAPAARSGVAGRPTVLNNVETIAHLALIARHGPQWFRQAGAPEAPGSTLLTLSGEVGSPGRVVEVTGPCTFGDVIDELGELSSQPRAVLLGGYEGTWIEWATARRLPVERHRLARHNVSLGCGVVGVLGSSSCGIAETARLLIWLASQSAGQCGPCIYGLPALSEDFRRLVEGRLRRGDLRRLRAGASALRGRGDCGHPTGVATLVESALDVFDVELARHLRGGACQATSRSAFPLPVTVRPS